MGLTSRPYLLQSFQLAALSLLCLSACGDAASVENPRALSDYRVDQVPQLPGGLPAAWAERFDEVLAGAPAIRLGDVLAPQLVHDLLTEVEWIDPLSIEVKMALPEGLRVNFLPKIPVLAIARGQKPVATLASDGTLIPSGFSEATMSGLLFVSLDQGQDFPLVGERFSDPVVQEAHLLWVEADTVAVVTGLPVVSIQRRSDYPRSTPGMAPAMSFVLANGVEISWGRASETADPASVNRDNKPLSSERKMMRLALVLHEYPMLQGVGRLVLDDPLVKAFDASGKLMPLPDNIR
ncbi:MAG: hypothetical protein O3A95_10130 [Planctomycetota bacterium]|nr:hypothetical protein [Planctomycetota bacterium]